MEPMTIALLKGVMSPSEVWTAPQHVLRRKTQASQIKHPW